MGPGLGRGAPPGLCGTRGRARCARSMRRGPRRTRADGMRRWTSRSMGERRSAPGGRHGNTRARKCMSRQGLLEHAMGWDGDCAPGTPRGPAKPYSEPHPPGVPRESTRPAACPAGRPAAGAPPSPWRCSPRTRWPRPARGDHAGPIDDVHISTRLTSGLRAHGFGLWVSGFGSGPRALHFKLWVWGFRLWVWGFRLRGSSFRATRMQHRVANTIAAAQKLKAASIAPALT